MCMICVPSALGGKFEDIISPGMVVSPHKNWELNLSPL